jgi:hypothetical protein
MIPSELHVSCGSIVKLMDRLPWKCIPIVGSLLVALALVSCAPPQSLSSASVGTPTVVTVAPVTEAGARLGKLLNGLYVEQGWATGQYVNWETGAVLDHPLPAWAKNTKTHCSGFASSVAARLGVPLPHPPFPSADSLFADTYGRAFRQLATRSDARLANQQGEWLARNGRATVPDTPFTIARATNWIQINAYQAQSYANQGYLTLAVRINPDANKPGHIAIIAPAKPTGARIGDRPAKQSPYTSLAVDGPFEAQSGAFNSSYTTVSRGFSPRSGPSTEWFGADSPQNQVKFYVYYMVVHEDTGTIPVKDGDARP